MTDTLQQEIKAALSEADMSFELLGAVLFGSRVRNMETEESDCDLLLMAHGINPKLHRRGEEIASIKKLLPPYPYDILLYTENEVISNFRNHNPLFLDIAEEGQIVFDKSGKLQSLIQETRQYVRDKGIKKLADGWVFPVRPGVATPL